MSAFKLRGFPDQAEATVPEEILSTQETTQAEDPSPKKRRGPYKKRSAHETESERIASLPPIERLLYALKDIKGAPDEKTLYEWKDLHGKFYMSSVDGESVFIWKTIKRTEYKNMISSGVMDKPGLIEEFVVRRALLWPKPSQEFLGSSDAGVISTLFKQIYNQSGFIADELALSLIEKI